MNMITGWRVLFTLTYWRIHWMRLWGGQTPPRIESVFDMEIHDA